MILSSQPTIANVVDTQNPTSRNLYINSAPKLPAKLNSMRVHTVKDNSYDENNPATYCSYVLEPLQTKL